MGVTHAEKNMLSNRRRGERRRDIQSARNYRGMERRSGEERRKAGEEWDPIVLRRSLIRR